MTGCYRPTWITVNLASIANNTRMLCSRFTGDTHLMAVVKADGYGHGAIPVAQTALANGADALGVATIEEGVQLREAGIGAPVLVLGGMAEAGADAVAQYGLIQTVFDAQAAGWLQRAAAKHEKPVQIAIKVDSGMGRIGIRDEKALSALVHLVEDSPGLVLTDVFTHFATADDDLDYARAQHGRFMPLVESVRRVHPDIRVHAANSAATLRYPESHHDMVRAGIALYVNPGLPDGASAGFTQAMRWTTHAVHVKEISAGESVSYGRIFTAARPTRVMTLPVGYADGYHRAIGGKGFALVRGKRVPVIGRVCMDQMMLDVTDIPQAQAGDEVVLLGRQGEGFISAAEMGTWCGMIDYEIVLSPTGRVPRIYEESGHG